MITIKTKTTTIVNNEGKVLQAVSAQEMVYIRFADGIHLEIPYKPSAILNQYLQMISCASGNLTLDLTTSAPKINIGN